MKRRTIMKEIIAVVVLMLVIIVAGSAVITSLANQAISKKIEDAMTDQFIVEANQLAATAKGILGNKNYDDPTEMLQTFVNNTVETSDGQIAYVVIIDKSATAVAHSDAEKIGKNYSDDTEYTVKACTEGETMTSQFWADLQQAWTYDVMVPIYVDDELYGSFDVGIYDSTIGDIEKTTLSNLIFIIIFILVMIFISLIFICIKIRQVVKVVNQSSNDLESMGQGKLNIEVDSKLLKNKTEIGTVANSLVQVSTNLREMIQKVAESSTQLMDTNSTFSNKFEDIVETMKHLNTAIEELADGASSQAQSTQDVTDSVAIMGDSVDASIEVVETLETSVKNMTEVATAMDDVLNELASLNAKTSDDISEINAQTMETNASVQRIKEAVNLIKDIASQTNLLSLNASIESARAGEAGKGFAVVAEEIRKLSEHSADSADEIDTIVQELIHNSDESVKTVAEVLEYSNSEKEKLSESVEQFGTLKVEVNSVDNAAKGILDQTKALKDVQIKINDSISSLSAITEQSAASLQESSASLSVVASNVDECKIEVAQLESLSTSLKTDTDKFTF